MIKKICFAGTLDPITNGHFWIIKEAVNLAEKVMVLIADNANKKTMFSIKERKDIIKDLLVLEGLEDKVEIHVCTTQYAAEYAKENGVDYFIRGIRNSADFDYENLIQKTNFEFLGGMKTLFLFPPNDLQFISSSFVKSLIGYKGWESKVQNFIPEIVLQCLIEKIKK